MNSLDLGQFNTLCETMHQQTIDAEKARIESINKGKLETLAKMVVEIKAQNKQCGKLDISVLTSRVTKDEIRKALPLQGIRVKQVKAPSDSTIWACLSAPQMFDRYKIEWELEPIEPTFPKK
jgi:hypothetical protein